MTVQKMTRMAIIITLYVALTYVFAFMSFGGIQFRVAEALVLLCFYKKGYAVPLILACAIANIQSPLGPIDVAFGTAGTLFGVLGILLVGHFKKGFRHEWLALFVASLFPVVANALLVGWELNLVSDSPFWAMALSVGLGEFAVVSLFGVPLYSFLGKNKAFMHMIVSDDLFKSYEGPQDKE
jgi:uncharacterized membrane protein